MACQAAGPEGGMRLLVAHGHEIGEWSLLALEESPAQVIWQCVGDHTGSLGLEGDRCGEEGGGLILVPGSVAFAASNSCSWRVGAHQRVGGNDGNLAVGRQEAQNPQHLWTVHFSHHQSLNQPCIGKRS